MAETEPSASDRAVIFTSDSHVGPRLVEDLRSYCPKAHLAAFDEYAKAHAEAVEVARPYLAQHPNATTAGHYDPHAWLRDFDFDGVVGGVIFHGSQNGEPFPFQSFVGTGAPRGVGGAAAEPDYELVRVGQDIYNRWLADFVSVEPARMVGLGYLPMWDVEAAEAELPKLREMGLRSVNFPPPRPGIVEYNMPVWDRFWSACVDLDMTLTTHASGSAPADYSGPGGMAVFAYEAGGWFGRRALWWLIFGGVFERHQGLNLVLTEVTEGWWPSTLYELDFLHGVKSLGGAFQTGLPRKPSEYARSNVFVGASPLTRWIVEDSTAQGWSDNVIFGSDYPHAEGTFRVTAGSGSESVTRMALRHLLAGVDVGRAADIVGRNALRAYGLDVEALRSVAERIGAPMYGELVTPPDNVPENSDQVSFNQSPAYLRQRPAIAVG